MTIAPRGASASSLSTAARERWLLLPLCHNLTDCAAGVACTERSLSAAGGTVNVCESSLRRVRPGWNLLRSLCTADQQLWTRPGLPLGFPGPIKHSRTVCELSSGTARTALPAPPPMTACWGTPCVNNGCHRSATPPPISVHRAACTARGSEYSFCRATEVSALQTSITNHRQGPGGDP